MKRWVILLPLVFVAGLVASLHAGAAVRDTNASADVHLTNGQYELAVANIGDMDITSFTFVPAPTLTVGTIASVSKGTCAKSGAGFSCTVTLAPPPCPCGAGDEVHVLFTGSGEAAGSSVQAGGKAFSATGGGSIAPATPPTTTTTATPPTAKPPTVTPAKKKKVVPKCKKGQKSTKSKPCHK